MEKGDEKKFVKVKERTRSNQQIVICGFDKVIGKKSIG